MATESAWDVHGAVDFPRGYHVEITDGKIIMVPQGLPQMRVIFKAARQIEDQLTDRDFISDVMVDFPSSRYGYAPDLAILYPGAALNQRGRYDWQDLEVVLEVVSKTSQDNDFVKKVALYASCSVPLYVVVDPMTAVCTVHSSPDGDGAYAESSVVAFGDDLVLPLGSGEIVIKTDEFPRAPR
jgi:Uma2 family endonuclease